MSLKQLEASCQDCRLCGLCATRRNVVFGVGNPETDVMFVGEGPGEQEDLQGEPFVGPAGQLLDDMLRIIDLSRKENCYIANIVKCRPPRNRDPLAEEQEACKFWLDEQMRLMDPEFVLCLGRIAAQRMIRQDFKITKEHGKWYRRDKMRLMAIYHPSALLRDERKRPETFADLREFRRVVRDCYPELYAEDEA